MRSHFLTSFFSVLICSVTFWIASFPVSAQTSNNIVLYAAEAAVKEGNWLAVTDATAAGGSRLANTNAGAAKALTPSANPSAYFEMTFRAEAGQLYRLWLRGRAESNSYNNDSVYVQFSGSLNEAKAASYRIGSTSALTVILEDCRGCGISGWGWQDSGYGAAVLGPMISFAQSGTQTLRIQAREDGLSIDQIVLSPSSYISSAPGATKKDQTILARNAGLLSNQPPQVDITAAAVAGSTSSPAASATATTTATISGTAPFAVKFSANASDPDGTIVKYLWEFGNGQSSTLATPTYTYNTPGSYVARLTVTDDAGDSGVDTLSVVVSASTGATTLKVLSWNIGKSRGTDEVATLDRTANWIAKLNPDIAALCEVMRNSGDDHAQRLVDLLQKKTGVTWYYHWVAKYEGCREGNMILSKIPLLSKSGKYLSHQRSVAQATLNVGGQNINFLATHLDPDSPTYRLRQVNELMAWAANFSETRIVGGDFNSGYSSAEMAVMLANYVDSWAEAVTDKTATAYADNPVGRGTRTRRSRIDYVLYSRVAKNLELKAMSVPDSRDLNNPNVKYTLGTADDKGVRPSDHNLSLATFQVK